MDGAGICYRLYLLFKFLSMNVIQSHPIKGIGYNFIPDEFLPKGMDEYHIRNIQHTQDIEYRNLTVTEINQLHLNNNTSDNWQHVFVAPEFNAAQIINSKFYGLVRIGAMQPVYKEFHDFKMRVGIYNSTIISCDLGNNICIDNVAYLSHFIIGDDVMIANVGELATTNYAKFGNGVIKDGENEDSRTYIEVSNENGGRSILPFNGMLAGDAFLWSKYRDDAALMQGFVNFTDKLFDTKRGYYGKIGDRTVIKNCAIIKDVWIGSDAYLKGANKIKNITINSDANRKSQIGEGCELVNGIVGFGCRIFYGVKAVRFVMSSHSQLKYGARLINSFLGNNSTISCCEVLNSLIFPSHEQHHNNSFLCASLVLGQSNIAAGVTIGSNHNSRAADGEIIAGRGFWPGLCVSLKHNSKFASFTLLAKGDYPLELNISLPFSLVSIEPGTNLTCVMPAYWFMYNMYALERNSWKTEARDRRTEKIQTLEQHYLGPDTIDEIFDAIDFLKKIEISNGDTAMADGMENKKKVKLLKVNKAVFIYEEIISFYAGLEFFKLLEEQEIENFDSFKKLLSAKVSRTKWQNIGGQLMTEDAVHTLSHGIKNNTIKSWDEVHEFYKTEGNKYKTDKLSHAYTSLLELKQITGNQFTEEVLIEVLENTVKTKTWMCNGMLESREKDYTNPFRKMVYDNSKEMNEVLGKLEDNSFIQSQFKALEEMQQRLAGFKKLLQSETLVQ